jgi:hypothetical protein
MGWSALEATRCAINSAQDPPDFERTIDNISSNSRMRSARISYAARSACDNPPKTSSCRVLIYSLRRRPISASGVSYCTTDSLPHQHHRTWNWRKMEETVSTIVFSSPG